MKKVVSVFASLLLCCSFLAPIHSASAATNVTVKGYNMTRSNVTNTLNPCLQLVNTGNESILLSNVKIRYYFTMDGNQTPNFACDYSSIGSNKVTGTFGTTSDSNYLEIGFTSNSGSLAAGSQIPIHIRIWKNDWSNFTQNNDYSFNENITNFTELSNVTAYLNGTLVWGTEAATSTPTTIPTTIPTPTATPTPTEKPTTPPTPPPTTTPTATPSPTVKPTETPTLTPGGSMKEISDAYMRNIKIEVDCPSNYSSKRAGVAYGNMVHKTYYSTTTRSNRGVNILLPANYSSSKQYPVLYVLHGIFGDENSMISGNAITEMVGNHNADGTAPEMIVVFPNMYASADGTPAGLSQEGMKGYDNFINDLVNDLMPYISANYSVLTAREYQAICGFSMGGREALFIGITRPDLFGYVMGICPAPGLTPGNDFFAGNHPGQLQESELRIKNPEYTPYAIMIAAGTNDSVVGTFPESYHNILTRNQQNHIYYTIPGAGHDNRSIQSGMNNFIGAIFHANR